MFHFFIILNMLVFISTFLKIVYFWTLLCRAIRLELHPILFIEMEVKQKQQVVKTVERSREEIKRCFQIFYYERKKNNLSVKSFYTYAGQFSFTEEKNICAKTCHNKILSALIHMSNVTLFFTSD